MAEKYTPTAYQERGISRVLEEKHLAVLLDPGAGKTSVILTAFNYLRDDFEVSRMLVIAPLAVCLNVWGAETAKWDHTSHLSVGVLHGKDKDAVLREDHDIYVINPEGLGWLDAQDWTWPEMLVVDESTRFKKISTVRFANLKRHLAAFSRRYALTGSPAPNGLLDLFGQIYLVDRGETFGEFITPFHQEHFVSIPTGGKYVKWEIRDGAAEKIYTAIAPKVLRMETSELGLPPISTHTLLLPMPPKVRTQYDNFRQDMVLALTQGDVIATNAGVVSQKCRQIANGRLYVDDVPGMDPIKPDGFVGKRGFVNIHGAKTEALVRLIDELGGKPVLVVYDFRHDLAAIRKALKYEVPTLGGETSPRRMSSLIKQWCRKEIPVLAVHPKTAGHGLNLQDGGHVLIWFAPTYDLELYDQTNCRLNRQGQTEPVLVYHLSMEGSVDLTMERYLVNKAATQSDLLDALREDV